MADKLCNDIIHECGHLAGHKDLRKLSRSRKEPMANPAKVPTSALEVGRDTAAAVYTVSYLRLMMRAMGVDDSDIASINAMALSMVEPLNHATETIFRALMEDNDGREQALDRFKESLNTLT